MWILYVGLYFVGGYIVMRLLDKRQREHYFELLNIDVDIEDTEVLYINKEARITSLFNAKSLCGTLIKMVVFSILWPIITGFLFIWDYMIYKSITNKYKDRIIFQKERA